jgi:hypothetical protein
MRAPKIISRETLGSDVFLPRRSVARPSSRATDGDQEFKRVIHLTSRTARKVMAVVFS